MIKKDFRQRDEIISESFLEPVTDDFFFATPALTQRQDLLRHLIRSGSFLLILAGDRGSGKSTLLKRLLASPDPQWKVRFIPPSEHVDNAPKLAVDDGKSLARSLEGGDDSSLSEQGSESIREFLRNCEEIPPDSDRILLIAIDDTEALSADDLGLLVKFSRDRKRSTLRIILVCQPEDIRRVRESITMADSDEIINTVDIPPLDEEQVGDYLHLRWNQTHSGGDDPFTDRVVRSIFNASKGLPANVNRLADQFLQNRRPNQGNRIKSRLTISNLSLPNVLATRTGRITAIVGAIILLMAFASLFFIDDREPPPGTETKALPVIPTTPGKNIPAIKSKLVIPENSGTSSAATPETSTPKGSARLATNAPGRAASLSTTTKALRIIPSREIEHSHGNTKTPTRKTDVKPASPIDRKVSSEDRTLPRKQTSARAAERGSTRTIRWLRRQKSSHYTIQLLGTSKKENMRKFLAKHNLGSRAAWFETLYNNRSWFVVVYGIYPTHKAATRKIRALPKSLRNLRPWPRTVGDILANTSGS
uniref:Cell division protein DamX, binds to the septal ring, contains C-terminal SPOR domain n=1 Tax=Candidatus Kentrum sp. SD TaxID=2126332 RepID=A0A451BMT2_9GAMM|nr:MAG: Cell division protein DamX, binds to the septal ring, contains C-terminal SPOR domain [Candidatus Kentron sp. SD]